MLLHLYGVVPAEAGLPEDLTGRARAPVRLIADDDLGVVVSEVADEAMVGRADLMAHAHLLEVLAARGTVVPMRFGVVMPDEDTVRREMLEHQRDHLLTLVKAFTGTVQLTLRATYHEEAVIRDVVARNPELRRTADDLPSRIGLGESVAAALEVLRREDESTLIDQVAPHATAVAVTEVAGALDVVNVALLVERARQQDLDATVTRLREQVADRMELRYVGPQAPFAFLDSVTGEEPAWG